MAGFGGGLELDGRRVCRRSGFDVTAGIDLLGRTDELGEDAPLPDELGISAGFDNAAVIEDQNAVGFTERAEPVGDQNDRAIGPGRGDGSLDQAFTDVVERRRSFVQNQNRRVLEENARQRDPLLLPPR